MLVQARAGALLYSAEKGKGAELGKPTARGEERMQTSQQGLRAASESMMSKRMMWKYVAELA